MICLLSIILIFSLPSQTKPMPTNDEIAKQISENRKKLASSQSRVVLYPSKHTRYGAKIGGEFTLFDENFESGMPAGWTVINGDGDFYTWIAGTYGFKKEAYEISLDVGRELFIKIERVDPEVVITDCETCKLQIEMNTPYRVMHPVTVMAMALKE